MTQPIEIRRRTHAEQLHRVAHQLTTLVEEMNGIPTHRDWQTSILAAALTTGAIAAQLADLEAQPDAEPTCGHPNPKATELTCTDVPHHYGIHDSGRTWWDNDTYPTSAGPCTAHACRLHNNHPGPCHPYQDHRSNT